MGAAVALAALLGSPSRADEEVILKVMLNGEPRGDFFVALSPGGDALLPPEDFSQLGFRAAPAAVDRGGKRWISLKSLSPAIRFRIEGSSLLIEADPRQLTETSVDFGADPTPPPIPLQGFSAILNYDLAVQGSDKPRALSLTLPSELAVRASDLLLYSGFFYARTAAENKAVRLLSNATWDDPAARRRLVFGDFAATSGPLGSGSVLGGISLSKNFSLTPRFFRGSRLDFAGLIQSPSEVDVYVNGVLVRSVRASPGELTLRNIAPIGGYGVATVVIRDAYGREQRFPSSFYFSPRLLAPGVDEYGYHLGFKRGRLGEASLAYDGLALLGHHRLGLTRSLTAGLGLEADQHLLNSSAEVSFALFPLGEVAAAAAASRSTGKPGFAGSLAWSFASRVIGGGLSVRAMSADYASLDVATAQPKPRLAVSATLGAGSTRLGSLTASLSATDERAGPNTSRIAISYGRTLLQNLSLLFTASQARAESTVNEVFAGINIGLGDRVSASANHQSQGSTRRETLRLQQSPPLGTGFGYRLLAENSSSFSAGEPLSADGAVQYKGTHGVYSLEAGSSAGQRFVVGQAAGSIVATGDGVHAARPVADSFAVVRVGNANDTRIYYSNQEVGVARVDRPLVIPSLVSYDDNRISIDDRDIGIEYRTAETARNVTTGWRGGGTVQFPIVKMQAFEGRLFLLEAGTRRPAEYATLELELPAGPRESVVGRGGELYLENLPPGRATGSLLVDGRECTFELSVPASDATQVNLGDIDCAFR